MKNLLTLCISLYLCTAGFSQDEPVMQTNNQEIGVDATPLLKQFLFNPGGGQNPYYLMYRYHFGKWALRGRIGGYVNSDESVTHETHDTALASGERALLQTRIGVERKIDFAKRWQFFYGIDLSADVTSYRSKTYNSVNSAESGRYKSVNRSVRYGAAPTLGFRFKINDRISLATETSLLVYVQEGRNIQSYYPNDMFSRETETKGMGTQFSPFTSLFFTFNF